MRHPLSGMLAWHERLPPIRIHTIFKSDSPATALRFSPLGRYIAHNGRHQIVSLFSHYGRFKRNWQDEEAQDAFIDQLEAGSVGHNQALMRARKLKVIDHVIVVVEESCDTQDRRFGLLCRETLCRLRSQERDDGAVRSIRS